MTTIDEKKLENVAIQNEYNSLVNLETKDFNLLRDNISETAGGYFDSELKLFVDQWTLKSLYFTEDWVYILIDRIASRIAARPMRVMKSTVVNGNSITKPAEGHPVQALLDKPNENQSSYEFKYNMVADFCITGNALAWKSTFGSLKLVHIPSELVTPERDTVKNTISSFSINKFGDTEIIGQGKFNLSKAEVIHAKRPNPSDPQWGLSPISAGRKSILFNRYSTEFLNNFYVKGAQPGLVIELTNEANEKNALRLLRSFELAYTGRKNQRRNMILPKGTKASPLTMSLADQQLKEYMLMNREILINLYQVPKHELSIAETGSLGSQEYKTALKNFWNGTLKSIMNALADSFTLTLKSELGDSHFIEFDVSDVEVLQDDLTEKASYAEKLLKTHTLNEVRKIVYELPPLPGGDSLPSSGNGFIPFSQNSVPKPVSTTIEEKTPIIEIIESPNIKAFMSFKESNQDWWNKREDILQRATNKPMVDVNKVMLDLFSQQAEAVARIIKDELVSKARVPDKVELKRRIDRALNRFDKFYVDEMSVLLSDPIELGYESQLTVPFNLPNRSQIEAARERNKQRRAGLIKERSGDIFKEINNTTASSILRVIEDGVSSNRTIQEIARDVAKNISDEDNIGYRAERIARTEVLTASSIGQAEAMRDVAKEVPKLKKMWINAGDIRVRGNPDGQKSDADHWNMQGQVRPHDKPFVDPKNRDKLMFPRDPNGKAGSVINCRCTFLVIPQEDSDRIGLRDLETDIE